MAQKINYPKTMQPIIERYESLNNEMALKIKTLNCMAKAMTTYSDDCAKAAEKLRKSLHECTGIKPSPRPKPLKK